MTRLAAVMGLERSDRSVRLAPRVDAVHARLLPLRKGGGLVDAPGRGLLGAKSSSPF